MVERFDEGVWLDLTLKAANRCASGLELPEQVGTRAQASASDRRALWLVAALLRSKLDLWHIYDLWRVGLEMLRGPHAHDPEAEAELRARLLEREFYEARTTPDESPTEPTDPQ